MKMWLARKKWIFMRIFENNCWHRVPIFLIMPILYDSWKFFIFSKAEFAVMPYSFAADNVPNSVPKGGKRAVQQTSLDMTYIHGCQDYLQIVAVPFSYQEGATYGRSCRQRLNSFEKFYGPLKNWLNKASKDIFARKNFFWLVKYITNMFEPIPKRILYLFAETCKTTIEALAISQSFLFVERACFDRSLLYDDCRVSFRPLWK